MKIKLENSLEYQIEFEHQYPNLPRVIRDFKISTGNITHYYTPDNITYGKTTCNIFYDNHLISHGESKCSKTDLFKKSVGREISLKRALEHAEFVKHEREQIWKQYKNRNLKKR